MLLFNVSIITANAIDYTYFEKIYNTKRSSQTAFENKLAKYPKTFNSNINNLYSYKSKLYAFFNNPLCAYALNYKFQSVDKHVNTILKNDSYASDKKKIQKAISVLNSAKVSGNNYTKAKKLRQWLTGHLKFSNASQINYFDKNSIYAICIGKGTCQAFSKCYKYLCDRYNIPCEIVMNNNHMWNIVKIENCWYNVEPQHGHYKNMNQLKAYKDNIGFLFSDESAKRMAINHKRITKLKNKCPKDYPHPKAPSRLKVQFKKGKAIASWKKGKNAKGYVFAWKYKSGKYRVIKTNKTYYSFKVKTNKTVYVKVKSYNGSFFVTKKGNN